MKKNEYPLKECIRGFHIYGTKGEDVAYEYDGKGPDTFFDADIRGLNLFGRKFRDVRLDNEGKILGDK